MSDNRFYHLVGLLIDENARLTRYEEFKVIAELRELLKIYREPFTEDVNAVDALKSLQKKKEE
jgi:hypothetical protein